MLDDELERDLNAYLATEGQKPSKGLAERAVPRDKVPLADIVTSGKVTPTVLTILKGLVGTTPTKGTKQEKTYRVHLAKRHKPQKKLSALHRAKGLDALVYPTIQQPGQPIDSSVERVNRNCRMAAHTGFPALSLPAGFTPKGMPVGMELLGTPFSEESLLAMGFDYEQATGHHHPPSSTPPLS